MAFDEQMSYAIAPLLTTTATSQNSLLRGTYIYVACME